MSDELDDLNDNLYDDGEDTMKDRYFTFQIGNEEYGIEIMYVIEVIGIQKITEVPDMPAFVKGVINLRGQVIPVMDVRIRFGMEEHAYDERTCIVVVKIKDSAIGMVVDMVSDVIDIPEENVDPPPKVSRKPGSRFIKGLGKIDHQVKILLEVQKLLYDEEIEQITAMAD